MADSVYDHRLDGGDYLRTFDGEHYRDIVCWAHGPGCPMTGEMCAPLPLAGSMADDCYDHLAGELLPEPAPERLPSRVAFIITIVLALFGWVLFLAIGGVVVAEVAAFVAAVR